LLLILVLVLLILILMLLLISLILLMLFVQIPGGLAEGVPDLVLGLVVSNVGPASRLRVLADQPNARGRFQSDGFQNVDNDRPLVVFGPGGHVPGDVVPDQGAEHLVALCVCV
jgi:hypothetical protein